MQKLFGQPKFWLITRNYHPVLRIEALSRTLILSQLVMVTLPLSIRMIRPRGGEGNYPHIIRMVQGLNNPILLIHIIKLDGRNC